MSELRTRLNALALAIPTGAWLLAIAGILVAFSVAIRNVNVGR